MVITPARAPAPKMRRRRQEEELSVREIAMAASALMVLCVTLSTTFIMAMLNERIRETHHETRGVGVLVVIAVALFIALTQRTVASGAARQ